MTDIIVEVPDLARVYELTDKTVANVGADYIYPEEEKKKDTCQYEYNGRPSCLVGHVLADLGVDISGLDGFADAGAEEILPMIYGEDFSEDVVGYLDRVQRLQDMGVPWGRAAALARSDSATNGAIASINSLLPPGLSIPERSALRRHRARNV